MNILLWISFGLMIGIIIDLTSSEQKRNIIGAVSIGTLGAMLGGLLGNLLLGLPFDSFHFLPFLTALMVSAGVLSIQRSVSHNS